jgi:putative hydrolase
MNQVNADGMVDWGPLMNFAALPKVVHGVRVLAGVEIDIVDFKGTLAFYDRTFPFGPAADSGMSIGEVVLRSRDIAIASLHMFPGCREGSVVQNTEMYLGAIRNPLIDIIGHPCRPGVEFDMDEIVRAAKETHTFLEINDHTFDTPAATGNCRKLAEKCAEEGTHIVVSSDAHSAFFVGEFGRAVSMLEEIHFPQELIANESLEKIAALRGRTY